MAFEQKVVDYKAGTDMERGVRSMTGAGWHVASQSSYTPRKGCLRTIAGGFLFFNRRPITVVTYRRNVPHA
jgi:hypothetical protein